MKEMRIVYTMVQRAEGKKTFWRAIGAAWVNRDGSLNVELDALPVNGRLQIREQNEPAEKADAENGK